MLFQNEIASKLDFIDTNALKRDLEAWAASQACNGVVISLSALVGLPSKTPWALDVDDLYDKRKYTPPFNMFTTIPAYDAKMKSHGKGTKSFHLLLSGFLPVKLDRLNCGNEAEVQ